MERHKEPKRNLRKTTSSTDKFHHSWTYKRLSVSWRNLQWLSTLRIRDTTWLWLSRSTVIVYNRC